MARRFTAASSQCLFVNSLPVSGYPFTMGVWFRATNASTRRFVMGLGTSNTERHSLDINTNSSTGVVSAISQSGATAGTAQTTAVHAANTWNLIVGVFAASNSRSVTLNGIGKVTNTTTVTPSLGSRLVVGTIAEMGSFFMDGDLAFPFIYNVALSDDDVSQLAAGFHPQQIRPSSLAFFSNLAQGASPEPDNWSGAYPLTVTGSPVLAEDPRIILPSLVT